MALPQTLSLHEVAVRTGLSVDQLYRMVRIGELKAFKLVDVPNATLYTTEEDFNAFLERRKAATATQSARKQARK